MVNTQMDCKYVCSLTKETKKIALDELHEDDHVRDQALHEMRDWIKKSSHIKNCRTDALFLLRFLRSKKFSVPLACQLLENFLISRQIYPQWFQKLDCNDKVMKELIDAGCIILLPKKHDGKAVVMTCLSKFNPNKYTSADMIKITTLVFETLMGDEENQVNGFILITDFHNYQTAHITLLSFKDVIGISRCMQTSFPGRQKAFHIFNFSSIFNKLLQCVTTVLSAKLRSRIFIHNTLEDLKTKIDPKILPKEYGGEVPHQDMVDHFKNKLREHKHELVALDNMNIEINKNNKPLHEMKTELGIGVEGSFKKLQID